ncbi:hypothetical protein Tco_1019457 [Tanacetum coccineum]|uniref:TF-B3 domain-containing protein n=1 Tax=Tanacetum coccineum TaxID=301880 RepID=A0ABQ5FZ38_9ASTR
MGIQFLVEVTQQTYRTKLVLPNVFTEILYTGYPWVYLIHNRGTKHKVWLEKVSGSNNYALFSREWKAFITDSRYVRVNTLHFIRAAPDEYYVTGYHNDGRECNGYDLDRVGFRQRRFLLIVDNLEESPIIPAHFFPNLVTKQVRVMVSDLLTSTVIMRQVRVAPNRHGYVLSGQGWHILVYVERIKVGSRLVFTNLVNNSISMIPFADSGLGLRFERVPRMPLNGLDPFVVSPIDNDPRMRHECVWDNHVEFHNDEKDCFYSPMVAYVTDRNRLVFHANKPDRRNHMNIIAPWRVIRDQCHFDANKMVRFKLIESVRDPFQTVNPLDPVMMPLFHMC